MIKNVYLAYGIVVCAMFAYASWVGWDMFAIIPPQRHGPAVSGPHHK